MQNLTKYLKARGVKNDAIYTSPSIRTVQSAMMIAKLFKKEYEIIDELKTRDCGSWNGLTFGQIMDKCPEGLDRILKYPEEKLWLEQRVLLNLLLVLKSHRFSCCKNIGNRIIIVTHPEVIQAAICGALDIPADKLPKIFIRTGSATQISYYENWASLVYSDYVPI